MIIIGLTGSIGMGKSTTAAMLERLGVPVHDADAEVHKLLKPKQKGFRAVTAAFPSLVYPQIYKSSGKTKRLNRSALAKLIFQDDKKRKRLEKILHSLVQQGQNEFLRKHRNAGRKVVVLDIPLLFETGAEKRVNVVLVASAPYKMQRARVLARPGMNEKKFRAILEKQMPDGEKCARADYVIHTGLGPAHAMRELKAALREIKDRA